MKGTARQLRSMIVLAFVSLGMLIVASLPLFASPIFVPSDTIVISQIYGAGGNSGATYQNDFIELFNRGSTTVNMTGWTVQYTSTAGSLWATTALSGSLAPGQYYLIRQAAGTSCGGSPCGAVLPAPDATGNIAISANAAKVALVNTTTPFTTTCPLSSTNLIDFVGYGSGAICFEGAARAPASSSTANSTQRLMRGCTETDNNGSDFATGAVRPRNTAYARFSCALTAENLLITEVLYDGTQTGEGDEFIEITNPLTYTVSLTGYKIGDEETRGGSSGDGMYEFPDGTTIAPNEVILVVRDAGVFATRFPTVTNRVFDINTLARYTAWGTGSLALANSGDEVLLLGPGDQIVDSVAWGSGNFAAAGVRGNASASEPRSLQRYGTRDTNNMSLDFLRDTPSPGTLRMPPAPPAPVPGVAMPNGMFAYWGDIHSHSTASDGDGPPRMAFDTARANGLHFYALTDHDAWLDALREEWNEIGSAASDTTANNAFIGIRGFEWTHASRGHINVFNSADYVSRDDPNYDTLAEFYAWLGAQPASVVAQFNHPDPSYGGTFDNFAYNSAAADKIALVEVGNNGSVPYQRFEPQYPQALNRGWRVAPGIGSDHHGLVWGNDSAHRTGIIASSLTTANVLDALRARRVFATEDANLALALQSNGAWMGSTIPAQVVLWFVVTARDPNPEPVTLELYDNGTRVATQIFPSSNVTWTVPVSGSSSHFYYVRATQSDGDIAYTAPIWTDNTPLPTPVLPTPTPRVSTWDLGFVSIDTARKTELHKRATLEGCVTVPPTVLSDRFFFLQDDTGGIKVYLPSARGEFFPLKLYDRVRLRGIVESSYGEREIELEGVDVIEPRGSCGFVAPKRYATGALDHNAEGWLAEVRGQVANVRTSQFQVNDGSGLGVIRIDSTTKIRTATQWRGQTARVVGVVSRSYGDTVIVPRYNSDIELSAPLFTPTRTPASVHASATRTPTPLRGLTAPAAATRRVLPTVSPTPRATRTPTPLPRAEQFRLNENVARALGEIPLSAEAVAVVGGSTSIATSFACFALALALLRRKKT